MAAKVGGVVSVGCGGEGEGGEIDVGGDVAEAGCGERVFGGGVCGKGAEGAFVSGFIVVFGASESVVGEEHDAGGERFGEIAEKGCEVGADFGLVVWGELAGRKVCGEGAIGRDVGGGEGEVVGFVEGDEEFGPVVIAHADEVEGEGVDDFVSEGNTGEGVLVEFGKGFWEEGIVEGLEVFFLGLAEGGEGFGDGVLEGGGGLG